MTIGCFQLATIFGTLLHRIGSRKTVPPRMLRIVPFGDFHISFSLNSSTRPSSAVMVAHFTPTPNCLIASAESIVIWSLVASRSSMRRSK